MKYSRCVGECLPRRRTSPSIFCLLLPTPPPPPPPNSVCLCLLFFLIYWLLLLLLTTHCSKSVRWAVPRSGAIRILFYWCFLRLLFLSATTSCVLYRLVGAILMWISYSPSSSELSKGRFESSLNLRIGGEYAEAAIKIKLWEYGRHL